MNTSRMRRAQASGPHFADHGPFAGEHQHSHPLFGDIRSHRHEHQGDGRHGGIAFADAQEGPVMAARGGLPGRIMNAAPDGAAAPPDAPPGGNPAAALDRYDFARDWGTFMAALRTEAGAREVRTAIRNAGLSEEVPSSGGFLVPWRLTSEVFAYLAEAIVYPRAQKVQMGASRLGVPTLDNTDQGSGAQALGGVSFAVTKDGDPIAASNPKWGARFLDALKLAALVSPVPNELASDAMPAFSDLFGRIVGLGLGWEIDELAINGTGAGEPEGLIGSAAALPVTRTSAGNAPVHADVTAMLKAAHPASKKRLTWLISDDVFDALLDEYLAVGSPTTQAVSPPRILEFDPVLGCWTLAGVPAEITDHQPLAGTSGDLILADLSRYRLGIREMMTIERSSQGSTFAADASAWRVRCRMDGHFETQGTFTLPNGKVRSPLVVLS